MGRRARLEAQLEGLEELDLDELRYAWRKRYSVMPPNVSAGLLRLALAYALQEQVLGGLPAATCRALRETQALGRPHPAMTPTMQLVREWKGVSHVVTMREDGIICWNDQEWRSLSAVARAITGTRWSGPAFFGLRSKRAATP